MVPLQRTPKWSCGTPGTGLAEFQSKSICLSMRVATGLLLKSSLAKY